MMTGSVSERHALMPVTLRLASQPDLTIEFVVDTGFTDFLALPSPAVAAIGLPLLYRLPASLANDDEVELAAHVATILWDGAEREVRVLAVGRRPLLGTSMLDGHELVAQFAESGLVTIDTL
jgi:clan AA aspartic protease